jgi:hypothetical protein
MSVALVHDIVSRDISMPTCLSFQEHRGTTVPDNSWDSSHRAVKQGLDPFLLHLFVDEGPRHANTFFENATEHSWLGSFSHMLPTRISKRVFCQRYPIIWCKRCTVTEEVANISCKIASITYHSIHCNFNSLACSCSTPKQRRKKDIE